MYMLLYKYVIDVIVHVGSLGVILDFCVFFQLRNFPDFLMQNHPVSKGKAKVREALFFIYIGWNKDL